MAGGKELRLAISIGGKIDKSLGSAINNAQAQLGKIGNIANKVGMAATAAVVAGTTKIVKDSIETYTSYESALNSAAAVAGVEKGSAAYEQMNAAAREAGATTVKTAKESAEALEYMALAGWSVEDSTKALTPILKLSAAAGMELATTSDLVTDTMAGMGLGINDLGRYLDVLSKANNSANHNAQQLLESYIGAGAVLRNLNVPVEKSAAILGVMANQGLKGSEAGTALNAILVNMQKKSGDAYKAMSKLGVSMYDSSGNARDLLQVFQDVHDKTASMTEQQRNLMYQMIGGKAHLADFAMIMNGFTESTETGTAQVYDLEKAYNGAQGTLDKFYDIKTDTLEGSITRLNSAYEGMLLNIGERLAPTVSNAVGNLVEKMPQIENAIVSFLEQVIPLMSAAIDMLTKNPDKVINTITGIAKAFVAFKAIKGIVNIATLAKDLKTLATAAGGVSVLKGAGGALTGLGTGAAATAAALAPIAGLLIGTGAAAYFLYGRLDAPESYKWVDRMSDAGRKIEDTSAKLTNLSKIQSEINSLKMTIHSDTATQEEIDAASGRISEIAEMLSREYGLYINVEANNLDETLDKVERITSGLSASARAEFNAAVNGGIKTISDTYSDYTTAVGDLPKTKKKLAELNAKAEEYAAIWGNISAAQTTYDNSNKNDTAKMAFAKAMLKQQEALIDFYDKYNIEKTSYSDMNFGALDDKGRVINYDFGAAQMWAEEFERSKDQFSTTAAAAGTDVKTLMGKIDEYNALVDSTTSTIAAQLANDIMFGDMAGIQSSERVFDSYIKQLAALGIETDSAVTKFALAKEGFADVATATAAGDEAIKGIIKTLATLGNDYGKFEGLDPGGVADKLSDMAHTIGLIPENKTITINAEGDYEIITAAENQIASLNSIGNVDISVNANGDFSVLNEATNEMQILQGMGAASLQVNADGNIDVLDKAQQVIATIDSKSAKVNISGSVSGMDGIQTAIDSQSELTDIDVSQVATGSFPGMDNIQRALQYQGKLENKKVTYTVIYKQEGTPPAHNAAGTPSWSGGLTYLNDQPGIADPREVVEYKGQRYWFGGRNVLADIPQGARIYNAAESRGMIDESEADDYRTGSGAFGRAIDRLRYTRSESGSGSGSESGNMNVTYSPNIVVEGNADEAAISRALRSSYDDFTEYMDRYRREERRKSFGVA